MADNSVPVEAVASGTSQVVGHYHYDIVTGMWQWDDQLFRIHGYRPGEVAVDLDLILSHKHPDDRDEASHLIEAALLGGAPFSAYQRIVTTKGVVRHVVKVGSGLLDENLQVVALNGFYVDLTGCLHDQRSTAVLAATEHRAAIEQAKGMVMLTHRIDADAAFALLRWWSMKCNVKLNVLAERLVAHAAGSDLTDPHAKFRIERALFDLGALRDPGTRVCQEKLVGGL